MTIKRRLVISNILMIIIPVTIALVVALGTMGIVWSVYEQLSDKTRLEISFEETLDLVMETVVNNKDSSELKSALKVGQMNVVVYDDAGNQYKLGSEVLRYQDNLMEAASTIDEEGFVTINNEEVYKEKRTSKGVYYTICMLYSLTDYDLYEYTFHTSYVVIIIMTIISIIIAIIITNHFLTYFVFRKIKQSLDLLADGVHEISNGNLDHRIAYGYNDEFAPVCEDFNDMATRLKQSVELQQKHEQCRKELLAGISHDLRSPLTSIKAYVEGLLDGVAKTPTAQINYMQMIKTKAEDIDHMVSKLFLFSKMDLGDYPYYPELLDLAQEILSYVKATAEEYHAKGLNVSIEQMEPGVTLYTDPIQLRSIFANILENSLKYKDKAEVDVFIFIEVEGGTVRIIIEDNGPGVSDEALGKLFDVFYRSDPSRRNPNKGSGLGLAITAKAVTRMNGKIYAQNREEGGLRIMIEVPMNSKEQEDEKNTNY